MRTAVVVVGAAIIVAVVAVGIFGELDDLIPFGVDPAQVGSSDEPVLNVDYDDSWVKNVPDVLGGYRVLHIQTPKNMACTDTPMITLQTPRDSSGEFVRSMPELYRLAQQIPGMSSNVHFSFSVSPIDLEAKADADKRWNAIKQAEGCIQWLHPIRR